MREFSDNGLQLAGAYGPPFVDQLSYVLRTLLDDQTSRQAVMTFWRPRPGSSKDIPCTVSLQFLARDGRLSLLVYMRSNDLWLGFPYDVFTFTQIQRYLAMLLGLQPGPYHHMAGSIHLYDRHWRQAEQVLETPQTFSQPIGSPLPNLMPPAFKATFLGISLMARKGSTDVLRWLSGFQDTLLSPWFEYLHLLAYHFHKDVAFLPDPYRELVLGQQAWKEGHR